MVNMQTKKDVIYGLANNEAYQSYYEEEGIVRSKLCDEEWIASSPEQKQNRRKQFLALCKREKGIINMDYYESIILTYDSILRVLKEIQQIYKNLNNSNRLFLCQRMMALLLIEIDNIDEDILPKKHVPLQYFKSIVDDMKKTMPEVDLPEFITAYDSMYKHWEF